MNTRSNLRKRRLRQNYRKTSYQTDDKYFGLLIQAEVCIIILLVVFVISFTDNSVSKRIKTQLKSAISLSYTYDDVVKTGQALIDRIFDEEENSNEETDLNTESSPKELSLPNQTMNGLLLQEEL